MAALMAAATTSLMSDTMPASAFGTIVRPSAQRRRGHGTRRQTMTVSAMWRKTIIDLPVWSDRAAGILRFQGNLSLWTTLPVSEGGAEMAPIYETSFGSTTPKLAHGDEGLRRAKNRGF